MLRCVLGSLNTQQIAFCHTGTRTLWRLFYVYIVTQWSGSGGIEASLSGQLASFSALTLLKPISVANWLPSVL